MLLTVFISNEMLKCLHIKGRWNSIELLEQRSLRDSYVCVLIMSVLRIHHGDSAFACSEDREATATPVVAEFKKDKSWLNVGREASHEKTRRVKCQAVVCPCHLAALPWRSAGCTGPPPRGRDSPASWWSQSSGWAGWRCLPLSWRTEHARTSAGTADDERRREFHTSASPLFLWPKQPTFLMSVHINIFLFPSCVAACFIIDFRLCSQYDRHYHTFEMAMSGSGDK